MKTPSSYLLYLLVLLSCLVACKSEKAIIPQIDTAAASLPLLAPGNQIGTIVGFNATQSQATEDSIAARWQEALAAGMNIGRLQIDWPELEPSPGIYDESLLLEQVQAMVDQGLQPFLTISAYDSDGPVLPADLEGSDFDDETLLTRFHALMDWVIPMLRQHQGWVIAIANEPDVNMEETPQLDEQMLSFLQSAKAHIHSLDEEMAVTITMAEGSLDAGTKGIKRIANASDVVSFNFYGVNLATPDQPQSPELIRAEIQEMLDFSGEKLLIFQELGMHSGADRLNSSEETQRIFFQTFFEVMASESRIRAACVFQLVDWEPETTELILATFPPGSVSDEFLQTFAESLNTIGLLDYETGERKAAWGEFLKWVQEFR